MKKERRLLLIMFWWVLISHSQISYGNESNTRNDQADQSIDQILTISDLLNELYSKNHQLILQRAKVESEKALIPLSYSPSNPKIGVMRESNMNVMQQQIGPMNSLSISQELKFPTKYFSMGSAQKAKVQALEAEFKDVELQVRQKALSLYYDLYSASRILALLNAQKETLREIARIAEARRATGAVPQQDEMKAHVEQTKIENEIILQKQEWLEIQSELNALLDRDQASTVRLPPEDLKTPELKLPEPVEKVALESSKVIASKRFEVEEHEAAQNLAKMSYLPDFTLSYRMPYGANSPPNAYSVGLEMTIPLWFFVRQESEISAASAKVMEAEHRLLHLQRMTTAETRRLVSKTKTLSKLLKIYETALVPQSTSALNSSRAAYSAGRVGFQELLDAERSLYSVRIEYYRNLARYVKTLTNLERVLGAIVSDLPMGSKPREEM